MKVKIDISKNKNKILFSSDLHFWHTNVIVFDKRPFLFDDNLGYPKDLKDKSNLDVESMNETLIENWNNVVEPNDVVFYLGDFCWRGKTTHQEILDRLNGKIYFIMGNHDDYKVLSSLDRFEMIADYIDLWVQYGEEKDDRVQICLFHYAIDGWDRQHHGSWHIHGHSHQTRHEHNPDYYNRKVIDAGCNGHNYEPIDFWSVKEIMDSKEILKHVTHE